VTARSVPSLDEAARISTLHGVVFKKMVSEPMPRKVRDSNLETRTTRSRLRAAHKPYFRLIEPGLLLDIGSSPMAPAHGSRGDTAAMEITAWKICGRRTARLCWPMIILMLMANTS